MKWRHPLATKIIPVTTFKQVFSGNSEMHSAIFVHVSDPFAAVFGNESFGGGFADFSALTKVSSRV